MFEKGKTAYILKLNKGRNSEPEIIETTIVKVGRKYITTNFWVSQFLAEGEYKCKIDSDMTLYNTREEAEEKIRNYNNLLTIRRFSRWETLPPEVISQIVEMIENAKTSHIKNK